MTPQPSQAPSVPPVAAQPLLVEQTRHLYAGLPASIAISMVLALILAAVQSFVVETPRLLAWLAMISTVLLGRAVLAGAWFRRGQHAPDLAERWLMRFRVGAIAAGVSWGTGCLVLFPAGEATHQVFIAFLMAGLSAGAITSLAVDRVSTLGLLVPALAPLIVRFGLEGGTIPLAMGTTITLFLIFIVLSARGMRNSLHENFQRRIEAVEREQKLLRSEERMNQAQQLAHLGSFEWNPVSGELAWSDEHFRLWGMAPQAVVPTYEIFRQGIHPDDVAPQEAALQQALKEGGYDCVHRVSGPDGRERHIHGRGEVLFDAAGRAVRMIGTVQDITQRVNAEKTLIAAKEAAELANRAKSVFLASMSHELRTPLNAILGYAQLMEIMPGLSGDVLGNAQEIKRAGDHLLSLVNDLLDLSNAESGRLEVHLEHFSLAQAWSECQTRNAPLAQAQQISLSHDGSCQPVQITADRRRLAQVLNHLVANAIKYNRPGGRVTVSCTVMVPGRVRLAVTDTGPGISPARQAQLFQPFNRLGVEMGKIEGVGIGLVLTRRLVEAMNGGMGVQSAPGRGSTFWVELPMDESVLTVSHQPALPAAALVAEPEPAAASQNLRVLVAEDYVPNQNVLRLQLRTLGCEAVIAADGAQALSHWRSGRYDLILTDLNMPEMDGLVMTRTIRLEEQQRGGHIPIVGITAATEALEIKQCRAAGMDDVLTKPIDLNRLRDMLAKWAAHGVRDTQEAAPVAALMSGADHQVLALDQVYQILGQVQPQQVHELVDIFLTTAREGLTRLTAGTPDASALAREMHKQKSSARAVGALRYAELAEALERQVKVGEVGDVSGRLTEMQQALTEVSEQAQRLAQVSGESMPAGPDELRSPALVTCRTVLLVDDDPVTLKQVTTLLQGLGVSEVLTARNGVDAIEVAARRRGSLDVLISDLSMPEMDGVELIRRLGQTGFQGGVILMSGADMPILRTVHELAVLQGLRVLGEVKKPVSALQMVDLLRRNDVSPAPLRKVERGPEFTAQAMREAIEREEFTVWFQPKVDAQSLRPLGLEALARWRRSDGLYVPPDLFITLAERDGLIADLSRLLMRRALQGGAQIRAAGFPLKLAVNLSGSWLDDLNLPDVIMAMVQDAGLKASDLVLEVTETGVMEDLTTALDVLTRLRLKGFGLSIDDFGIGYSSFEQLGRIPFTEMKLDRSFVSKGARDMASRAILESSMAMAQKLGLTTVAEGVETQADLDLVRFLGCDAVQGNLLAQPMPEDELLVWLAVQSV